ncbi:MAG: signal peptidase II [Alphaproteobacteria bacterium]|nr:signal peptidase II [Alphaproteobacteria bacterium]
MSRNAKLFWLMFAIFLVLDQASKIWIYTNLAEGPGGDVIQVIPGWFDLVHAENPGAAFSLLRTFEYRHLVFLAFTVVAIWVIWDQFKRLREHDAWMSLALGLIASGAVGNAIDRVYKRTVTDFLRLHVEAPSWRQWLIDTFGTNEYPSFNIADSALLVGVAIFFFASLAADRAAKADKAGKAEKATASEHPVTTD